MDETLRKILDEKRKKLLEKKKKEETQKNDQIPETNSPEVSGDSPEKVTKVTLKNNQSQETNSPEVLEEMGQKVTKVTLKNGDEEREKHNVTFVTSATSTTKTSGEFSSYGEGQNSTEVNREQVEKVTKVTLNSANQEGEKHNVTFVTSATSTPKTSGEISSTEREKHNVTFVTSNPSTPKTSGEFGSEELGESVEVKDNVIVIKNITTKNKVKYEIFFGFVGTVEDSTRIKDLKVPQLPRYEFVAKRPGDTLNLTVTVDFYEIEGKMVFYIRNRKEIVERLYKFKGDKRISKKLINDALDVWLEKVEPQTKLEWVDITEVVKKYDEWDEITKDPISFFLNMSSEVVGNEKLKVAVLLSTVSSQLDRLRMGIYRVHLILTGSSGAGKSSTIKSILDLFFDNSDGMEDFIVLKLTRMTKEALGRLRVNTMDGRVFFVEQLDNVEGVDYLREAMSEGHISTLATVKDEEGNLASKTIVIPGQPSFITTNVTANVDHQIMNRSIQLYLSPTEDEKLKRKIIETVLDRAGVNQEDIDRIKLLTYVWLKTRPKFPKMTKEVKEELVSLLSKVINFKNIYRATEITRNLVRATASLFGREEISKEDVNFVMDYFKKDIILTTLELSERDLQLLRWLRDHGYTQGEKEDETRDITTSEVAQVLKMSTQETKKILDGLYDKGLTWKAYDGKKFMWAISHYGVKVLGELEREVEGQEVEEEVMIDDQLFAIMSSKLMGKTQVTEEELRGIVEKVAQASDLEVQDLFIKGLETKKVIKNNGDGTWKVL